MKFIFLGVQGSGKSTQAKLIAEKLSLPYIEMGKLFRDKREDDDEDAKKIRETIDHGKLVPDELAIRTLRQRLSQADCKNGYVLDGYPRNKAQLKGVDRDVDKVFYIHISDDEAIKRLTLRARHDDTQEALKKRMSWHHSETEPLLAEFRQAKILEEVDGERTIEEIADDIKERVLKYAKKHAG